MLSRRMEDARIAVLADDGRWAVLGRYTTPSEEEIAKAAEALRQQGIGGWLAVMSHTFYSRRCPALCTIREIAPPRASWDEAAKAFQAAHAASLADMPSRRRGRSGSAFAA